MPIIAGHAEVDPDDRDEAVALTRDPVTRACDAPGCLDAAITADVVDPTRINIFERWDRDVLMHGAYAAQRALEAGVLDELLISHVLVLFGAGRQLFGLLTSRIELEVVRVIDTPEATHIRYRIRR
jgi:dihydrofolate reductase